MLQIHYKQKILNYINLNLYNELCDSQISNQVIELFNKV